MKLALQRLSGALQTWPDRRGWIAAACNLLWALPLIAVFGWIGGFVRFDPRPFDGSNIRLAATLLLVPALGEELLFRGLLVPRPERPFPAWQGLLAVGAFVAWHPLQTVTWGPPWSALFLEPWFLAAVAVLGVALVRIYRATGSIWPCVAAHWLLVGAWKLLFGGPFG